MATLLELTKGKLAAWEHLPNKALGQNFLIDGAQLDVIAGLPVFEGKTVLEIGAGLGTLTQALSRKAKRVIAVEVDKSLEPALRELCTQCKNAELIMADFMDLDIDGLALLSSEKEICVAGNLPYYITTPICMKLLRSRLNIASMVLMVQQEAAERFFAKPSSKVYGPLTVLANAKYRTERIAELSPQSYYPQPTVHSSVVLLQKLDRACGTGLDSLLKEAFSNRRKTLVNNLKGSYGKESIISALSELGRNENVRAEALGVEEFMRLSSILKQHKAEGDTR